MRSGLARVSFCLFYGRRRGRVFSCLSALRHAPSVPSGRARCLAGEADCWIQRWAQKARYGACPQRAVVISDGGAVFVQLMGSNILALRPFDAGSAGQYAIEVVLQANEPGAGCIQRSVCSHRPQCWAQQIATGAGHRARGLGVGGACRRDDAPKKSATPFLRRKDSASPHALSRRRNGDCKIPNLHRMTDDWPASETSAGLNSNLQGG